MLLSNRLFILLFWSLLFRPYTTSGTVGYDQLFLVQFSVHYHPRNTLGDPGATPVSSMPITYCAGLSWQYYILLFGGSTATRYGTESFYTPMLPRYWHLLVSQMLIAQICRAFASSTLLHRNKCNL